MFGADDVALATLDEHRLLCAHREGPYGVRHWNRQVEKWLSEETGQPPWSEWYPGRPLLVTANDYGLRVYNGDTGVVVNGPDGLRAVIAGAGGPLDFATSRLSDVETMHAMTIHKSQGSQADEVTVLMPTEDSRLLTRELFYTAVTRAKKKVRVVGSEAVRAGRDRTAGDPGDRAAAALKAVISPELDKLPGRTAGGLASNGLQTQRSHHQTPRGEHHAKAKEPSRLDSDRRTKHPTRIRQRP